MVSFVSSPSIVGACLCQVYSALIDQDAGSLDAYIKQPVHKKARHCWSRRLKKKLHKQQRLLTEVVVPTTIKHNLLSVSDIVNEVVVVDGGDDGNPPIFPPD